MSLSEYIFLSKYAKYNNTLQRRETYPEAVTRMLNMHSARYADLELIQYLLDTKTIGGSQRALQFGGSAILEKNERIYNCTVSYADRPAFFSELFFLLLCGCGTGFSVQHHHVSRLPPISAPTESVPHVIPDSIEGWADAVHALLLSFFTKTPLPIFDYSKIRPQGAPLRHGGKAPGPEPLSRALSAIQDILYLVDKRLRPIEVFDICMHLADAVLSGGVRRSATIAIFSIDDQEMLTSKTEDWFVDNPQRARANISAMITPEHTKEEFLELFESTKQFGEPGFYFAQSTEHLPNPCVEITMAPVLIKKNGVIVEEYTLDLLDPLHRSEKEDRGYTFESGWQCCNLSTINCSNIENEDDFLTAVSGATVLGTIQASYTDFSYLGSVSKQIVERESLLGVSLTGILSNPSLFCNEYVLRNGADTAKLANRIVAKKLGIAPASRITCVKPEGTTSLLFGTSAGIHPYHANQYIRRVQANAFEPLYQHVKSQWPSACSPSVWGDDEQRIISFACQAPADALTRGDLSAIEHLTLAKTINENWVRKGTAHPERLEGAYHNVSITVSVQPDEWVSVSDFLWKYRDMFSGVSLLSSSGDYDYPMPPFQGVTHPFEISSKDPHFTKKNEMYALYLYLKTLPPLDFSDFREEEDNTDRQGEIACGGGQCEI